MTPLAYIGEIRSVLRELSDQTGWPVSSLYRSFIRCYAVKRAGINEFRSMRLYERSSAVVKQYLLWHEMTAISDRLNAEMTEDDYRVIADKHLFNEVFAPFIRRRWLYVPACTEDELREFLDSTDVFLAKECGSMQGHGILRFESRDIDPTAFLGEYAHQDILLEEFIRQHPDMSAVNPGSVNTIRFIAAHRGNDVGFVGAGLRCGGAGQFVDNYHSGGVAYPLDIETGIVTGQGYDHEGRPVLRHPTTGHIMPGFQVPHWDNVRDTVRRAALTLPRVGYVGWDIAVTEDSAELIEGNINYPGNTVIQLDGPGPLKRLTDFLGAG